MQGLLTFIIVFGILVVVHEFGHFYFAKKSGILTREFAVGMGPKIFAHTGRDGTVYTIRLLPLGGYVRMAGWGDEDTKIKTGSPASLSLSETNQVTRINLSDKSLDTQALPMNILSYDLEDQLEIEGLVLGETRTYSVASNATIVEADGTELRIAPLAVQYQNASTWGRFITNFAGPMNNFILGVIVFILMIFLQGGVRDVTSNQVRVLDDSPVQQSGLKTGDRILAVNHQSVTNWDELTQAVEQASQKTKAAPLELLVEQDGANASTIEVKPQKQGNRYLIGVAPALKTGFWDKIQGGFQEALRGAGLIMAALKQLITNFSLDQLGGPVAIYQLTSQASSSGLVDILYLMGMLSINLGIFNLIPIPALDGGKIVIVFIEAIRRKPLKQEVESYITLAGVAIMVLLMLAVTWNDIMRVFF